MILYIYIYIYIYTHTCTQDQLAIAKRGGESLGREVEVEAAGVEGGGPDAAEEERGRPVAELLLVLVEAQVGLPHPVGLLLLLLLLLLGFRLRCWWCHGGRILFLFHMYV